MRNEIDSFPFWVLGESSSFRQENWFLAGDLIGRLPCVGRDCFPVTFLDLLTRGDPGPAHCRYVSQCQIAGKVVLSEAA